MVETQVSERRHAFSTMAVRGWLGLVGLISMLVVVPAAPRDYLMTFWVMSYGRGYRARALPASILQWLGVDYVTLQLVAAVSALLLLAALAMLVELAARAYRNDPGWPTLLLGLLVVGSPVTLRFLAFDVGAFDHLTVVLTLGSLLLLLGRVTLAHVVAVAALATVGVLVHEAYLLINLPLVLAALVARRDPPPWGRVAREIALVAVGPLLALAWIGAAPPLADDEVAQRKAVVERTAEVDPANQTVGWPIVNHTRTFTDNLSYTARRVQERGHRAHVVAALACIPSLAAAAAVGRHRLQNGRRLLLTALWAVAVAGPLLMVTLGHDWGRWFALATFNGLVAVVWASAVDGAERRAWSTHTPMVLMAIALVLPSLARDAAPRASVGNPILFLRTILGL